jgi:hypothetical protein
MRVLPTNQDIIKGYDTSGGLVGIATHSIHGWKVRAVTTASTMDGEWRAATRGIAIATLHWLGASEIR